jgi:cytochrome oxidase assembly protein ShyY1
MPATAPHKLRFRWDPEWRLVLLSLMLVPLFAGLGFWQLARAEEKRQIGFRSEQQRLLPRVSLESLDVTTESLAYRPVLLEGVFLHDRDFLLDNRTRQGRYGMEVLTPLRLDQGALVLVNRGWMAADPSRRELPAVPVVEGRVALSGYVYVPPGESYTLGEIAATGGWPRLVQAIEMQVLGQLLQEELWPHTVRLDAGGPPALLADWPLVNVRPEKHQAYALQWFAMSAVLSLFAVWRNSNLSDIWRARREGEESR